MNLPIQTLLHGGKYRILSQIAQGGFGITYRAEQTNLGRSVCIKEFFFRSLCERQGDTLHVTSTQSGSELVASFRKKFEKEAKRLAAFDHPNIVKVLDIFEENGTAYIVMEYVEGETLQQLVTRKGRLTEAEALAYILPICEALSTIHTGGLLHLDVKPSNILVNRVDNRPVLIDFGTSKFVETDEVHHTTTAPLALSKGYAPMEQYGQDLSKLSPATDVYGVGATLYKCLTGLTPPEPMEQVISGMKSPQALNPAISGEVSAATLRAMATNPANRPKDAAEFSAQLRGGACTEEATQVIPPAVTPPQSQPETSVESTLLKPRSKPYLWIGGALLVVVALFIWLKPSNGALSISGVSPVVQKLVENMVYVEGGTFTMGANLRDTEAEDDESPRHQVTLSSYRIGKYEVTQAEWREVMGRIPPTSRGITFPWSG